MLSQVYKCDYKIERAFRRKYPTIESFVAAVVAELRARNFTPELTREDRALIAYAWDSVVGSIDCACQIISNHASETAEQGAA